MSESEPLENSPSAVNPAEGDFVGRDDEIFQGLNNPVDELLKRIREQIEHLRGQITKLVPVENNLFQLVALREPKPVGHDVGIEFYPLPALKYRRVQSTQARGGAAKGYLEQLRKIEEQMTPNLAYEELSRLLPKLSAITDEMNCHIAELKNQFVSLVHSTATSQQRAAILISKIEHKEFKDEAASIHLAQINGLMEKLNNERLVDPNLDILSDEATAAIGMMAALEQCRLAVEQLVHADRRRRQFTIVSVVLYILLIFTPIGAIGIFWGAEIASGQVPLLGIPWSVVLWGLLGSVAATIFWFNTNSVSGFIDSVKWFATRPALGIMVASIVYLILNTSTRSPDKLVWILCFFAGFFAGFSDRCAISAFGILERMSSKYTTGEGVPNSKKQPLLQRLCDFSNVTKRVLPHPPERPLPLRVADFLEWHIAQDLKVCCFELEHFLGRSYSYENLGVPQHVTLVQIAEQNHQMGELLLHLATYWMQKRGASSTLVTFRFDKDLQFFQQEWENLLEPQSKEKAYQVHELLEQILTQR